MRPELDTGRSKNRGKPTFILVVQSLASHFEQGYTRILPRADMKTTLPWFVAMRYYRELINLLKYLLYLFIIRGAVSSS